VKAIPPELAGVITSEDAGSPAMALKDGVPRASRRLSKNWRLKGQQERTQGLGGCGS